MKRKYREAMRAAARERNEAPDDDDEALEALGWYEEWATPKQQDESNNKQRSKE